MGPIAFLVTNDPRHGLGHWRRMGVLATALKAEGAAVSLIVSYSPVRSSATAIYDSFCSLADAVATAALIVLDGKDFAAADLSALAAVKSKLVLIDDMGHPEAGSARLVINPNIYGHELTYDPAAFAEVLAGPQWNLIDPRYAEVARETERDRIAVCFGGADDGSWALPVLAALKGAVVWLDAGQRKLVPAMRDLLAERPDITQLISPDDMAGFYACTDILVCGAGQMAIEGLASGCKVIAVKVAADQALQIKALEALGVTVFQELNAAAIAAAAGHAAKVQCPHIAGGPARVAKRLMELASEVAV
ncbi:hypothetical protein [Pseudokordiimonas caeni]|uniref:hypothetical protein n=1 Tax=Pseudokordiimonas caeni TaxID=2997908 RepID=UPI002811D4FE|nr:hypothetical protein [Pseudokordiimonas caeni]